MTDIAINPLEPGRFAVTLGEGTTSTRHRVTVPAWMTDDPELGAVDPEVIVHESMEFSLDVIPRYFPDYDAELRRRLSLSG